MLILNFLGFHDFFGQTKNFGCQLCLGFTSDSSVNRVGRNHDKRTDNHKECREPSRTCEHVKEEAHSDTENERPHADRVFAKSVINNLLLIVNNAVKAKVANINCNDVEQLLADSLSTQNLIDILDIITTAETRLNSNINMNLFSSWFCAELRRQK